MTMQLVDVLQRPDAVCTHKPLIPNCTQPPKHLRVRMQHHLVFSWFPGALPVVCLHRVCGRVRVNPLLDFDLARAVGNLVCDICSLRADIEHLAGEYDAGRICAVDLVVGFRVRLGRVQRLLDCNRPESVVVGIATLFTVSSNALVVPARIPVRSSVPDPGPRLRLTFPPGLALISPGMKPPPPPPPNEVLP